MVDIVLDSDDLTVLGGPSTVSVQVDIGAEGDRGSIFVVGTGEPNSLTQNNTILGVTVQAYDMYINVEKGSLYSKMYQYVPGDGGTLTWEPVLTLLPGSYAVNKSVTFSSGSASISDIAVADIVDLESISGLTASNFNVQISFDGTNSVASAVTVSNPSVGYLPIAIKAHEFNGTSWTALSGSKTVYVLITVV